jgi:hypothetical protein
LSKPQKTKLSFIGEYRANALLGDLLERRDDIEGITLAVAWKDGRTTAGWTNMARGDVAFMTDFLRKVYAQQYLEPQRDIDD